MKVYKSPDKMSKRELKRVAEAAERVLRHSGYGGWSLQEAYANLEKTLIFDAPDKEGKE
jgi:hypothetical protein